MAHIDDARPGLKAIMIRRLAESWTEGEEAEPGFYIYEKVKGRSKHGKFFVPLTKVEACEQNLKDGTFLPHTTYTDLREISD